MPRYMQSFATSGTEQEAITQGLLAKPYVAVILDENRIDWGNEEPEPDYSKMPLTFEIISGGTIYWRQNSTLGSKRTIEYSKNGGEWVSITSSHAGGAPSSADTAINVIAGDIVQFRGNNVSYAGTATSNYNSFTMNTLTDAIFDVYGNIMSLIRKTKFDELSGFSATHVFRNLFSTTNSASCVRSIENLVLPAKGLTPYCYSRMFGGCNMVTIAPELPAEILADYCYDSIFAGCGKLRYIKCLATDITSTDCTKDWLKNVASTGTFVKNANMSSWTTGVDGIPTNWTVVDA